MAKERLRTEHVDDVAVVFFLDKRILDEPTIQAIAEKLFALVEDGQRKLLLNFTGVEYMSSAALGKLINLHKKLGAAQGKLALCNVIPQIFEIFTITKLDKIFKIYPDDQAAMNALKA